MAADVHRRNKRAAYELLGAIAGGEDTAATVAAAYAPDARWHGPHPLNDAVGAESIAADVWSPLRAAFPDLERRDQILVAGDYGDQHKVAAMGHLQGTFARDWLGIPASNAVVNLRYGEVHAFVDGRIVESYVLWDFLELMRQAGVWPLPPSLGAEGPWAGPASNDGVRPDELDLEGGAAAREMVMRMHRALLSFDGINIDSMSDQANCWSKHFMWYGPSGIGTTRGLEGFQAHHQIPFLRAFPNRKGGGHFVSMGDGRYVVTGGWTSVVATHSGDQWLGLGATGKQVGMRVMDFYRIDDDGLIAENWVPIDIIDVLRQLGYDVFARLEHLGGRPSMTL